MSNIKLKISNVPSLSARGGHLPLRGRRGQTARLAVFDIDGTIFRSSLVIELSSALVHSGVFPKSAHGEIQKEYQDWLNRKGTYEAYIDKVVKIYVKYITGKKFTAVNRVAQRVISFQKDRVYRFTRDLIKKLKKQNYLLVAISGSPSYIVEKYAKTIGFDLFFGTELEIVKGKFTGKVVSLDSAYHKNKIVESLARQYQINLKQSLAVGDTESDVPMLSLVGQPIAFNPNLQLVKIAKRKGWRVVVERKDVVFEFSNYKLVPIK